MSPTQSSQASSAADTTAEPGKKLWNDGQREATEGAAPIEGKLNLAPQNREPVPVPQKFCSTSAGSPAPMGAETFSALVTLLAPISLVSQSTFDIG